MTMTTKDFKIAMKGLDAEDWINAMEAFENEVRRQYISGEKLSKEEGEQKIIDAVCAKVPQLASKEVLERGRTADSRLLKKTMKKKDKCSFSDSFWAVILALLFLGEVVEKFLINPLLLDKLL